MSKAKNTYKCPCCSKVRYESELEIVVDMIKDIHKKEYPRSYKEGKNYLANIFSHDDMNMKWACDDCLNIGKAIKSIPVAVETSGYPPFAYFDYQKNCDTCRSDFTFSKEEQKFWYENLKFNIDATAKNCVSCREIIRKQKQDNFRLSELLKKESLSLSQLQEVADIYKKIGNTEKMNRYLNLIKKLPSE